ncbi:hypothetical protein ACFYVL_10225 [Streptomyces sp. NPDC004111]|uniref:hypothetical protein n=1 Tax=Streptomyces sp. NPDC004111 TaxID=3364690 RepID=UPI0036CA7CC8
MAVAQLSRAPYAPAHPMATPGFGKRSAPDQLPHHRADFSHLPAREAAIAGYIDRLPDGADISIKTLAREIAAYGQCAVASALRRLSAAGHLRRFREALWEEGGSAKWVQRTYFSRTQRPDAWWQSFVRDESTTDTTPAPGTADDGSPEGLERQAYEALAELSHQVPQLTLSENACRELAPYAAEWLRRGASRDRLQRALGQVVPVKVHSPFHFVRSKLLKELPPVLPAPRQGVRAMECTGCGAPGEPAALPGGLCRPCRSEPYERDGTGLPSDVVHGKARRIRHDLRERGRERGGRADR